MRKVIYAISVSLDGLIEATNGDVSSSCQRKTSIVVNNREPRGRADRVGRPVGNCLGLTLARLFGCDHGHPRSGVLLWWQGFWPGSPGRGFS